MTEVDSRGWPLDWRTVLRQGIQAMETIMTEDDCLTKEGASRLCLRLQALYGDRVLFRVEQDKYGVWGVRSNMVRGVPKDGKPYTREPQGIVKDRKSTKKPNGVEEIK